MYTENSVAKAWRGGRNRKEGVNGRKRGTSVVLLTIKIKLKTKNK